MASDSAGYNTSSLFQARDYNPTNSALVNGLQNTATYDPTTQSTTSPTSAARYLAGGVQSLNTAQQDTASTTQNTQSNSGYAALADGLSRAGLQSNTSAGATGLTAASNNAVNSGYASTMATNAALAKGGQSKLAVAPNANLQATAARTNTATYSGNQTVAVRTKEGNLAYYQFDPASGSYKYINTYGASGAPVNNILDTTTARARSDGSIATDFYATNNAMLSATDRANAVLQSVAGNQLYDSDAVRSGANIVNQMNSDAIAAYTKANQQASANAQATTAAGLQASTQQSVLDYMTTHGGQLPPGLSNMMSQSYAGDTTMVDAQKAGIAAAQQAFAAQQAHSAALSGIAMRPIDTSASDATDQASLNSLISQYATSGVGGLASRFGGNQAASLTGQNALNHDLAAATSYNTNLGLFGSALGAQNNADVAATGNQLFSDIQSVQQIAEQLQQEMGQLGATARAKAQSQLDQLNNAVAQYQAAVREYGQGSANAMILARGILSSAASVSSAVV